MTPLLPFLEDTEQNIREMVKRTADTGARFLYGIMGVTIRDGQREYFYDALTKRFPGERLAERYAAAYGNRYSCASPGPGNSGRRSQRNARGRDSSGT